MMVVDKKGVKVQFPVGIVVSRFNEEFTGALLQGALKRLKDCDFKESDITVVWVPGAVEIPIAAQRLAETGVFEALICLGAVIRGETTHYDYVCEQVSQGCQHVALQNDLPVIFGIITTENEEQAADRVGGKHGHKGIDAVDAAMEMVATLRELQV